MSDPTDWQHTDWAKRSSALTRFMGIMRRHVYAEDIDKSDDEIVHSVMRRYEAARTQPLIDPNE